MTRSKRAGSACERTSASAPYAQQAAQGVHTVRACMPNMHSLRQYAPRTSTSRERNVAEVMPASAISALRGAHGTCTVRLKFIAHRCLQLVRPLGRCHFLKCSDDMSPTWPATELPSAVNSTEPTPSAQTAAWRTRATERALLCASPWDSSPRAGCGGTAGWRGWGSHSSQHSRSDAVAHPRVRIHDIRPSYGLFRRF